MSWLGNGFREEAKALSDAYASMYAAAEQSDEVIEQLDEGMNPFKKSPMDKAKELDRLMRQAKDPFADTSLKKEAFELWAEMMIDEGCDFSEHTYEETQQWFEEEILSEKKKDSDKCGEGTYWDKEEKKCKKKKSSSKTTVVVGRGGIYGPGYHGGGGGSNGDGDGGDTDGGDGGDGGGDGGGGGGE